MNKPAYHTSSCSAAYAELINLLNTAKFHKDNCNDPTCGVALFSLRQTAGRLIPYVWQQEKKAAIEMWEQFPLT